MAYPLHVPRINNNDDHVRVLRLTVREGDRVKRGDVVAEVETDKSVADVEAERDGYVLKVLGRVDEQVAVGSVLLWLGEGTAEPTAKARALLARYGLSAEEVPASGDRLSAAEVEAYVARRGTG